MKKPTRKDLKGSLTGMEKEHSLSRAFLLYMVVVTIVSIVIVGGLWTWQQYSAFREDSGKIQETMLASYKNLLKSQVQKSVEYILYRKSITEERLRASIREKVYEAHAVASHLHAKWKDEKSPQELRDIIRESLREMRFNQGRGYFFIMDLQGVVRLRPDLPEIEGRNLTKSEDANEISVAGDMIRMAEEKKEGFYRYNWTKPGNPSGRFPKMAFIKLFKPYNWIIGTGEYLDDFEANVKTDVLNYIETIRFEKDGYIFVTQWDGLSLTEPAKGKNMIGVTDVNGVHIVQEFIRLAKSGDGFLQYVMPKLKGAKPDPKLSYVQGIRDWKWYVGAGIYIDDIDKAVAAKQAEMTRKIKNSVAQMTTVLLFLVVFAVFFARRISAKARNSFDLFTRFFEKSARESAVIDPEKMEYEEFENLAHSANDMIKARIQAEEALIENQIWLQQILDSIQAGVVVIDPETHEILESNRAALEMIGTTKEDLIHTTCHKHICPNEIGTCPVTDFGQTVDQSDRELITADGTRIPILKTVNRAVIKGKAYLIESFLDMRDKKRLESMLLQAQKMEAIGTLAGGIAHDFNNILFPILGYTEMLIEDTPEDSPSRSRLKGIHTSALRARDLVNQILAFSRREENAARLTDIQPIIEESLKLIRSTIPTNISIIQHLQPDCGAVKSDPAKIHQIIMNLATNAYHAVEENGGEIKVSLKEIRIDQPDAIDPEMAPGLYGCLTVSDTGIGMDRQLTDKIFDPFFTTKEKGKGTGMGLSVVHGIVKNLGGSIQVHSLPGKGTDFHVYLPVSKAASEIEEIQANEPVEGGTERILLVDDEKDLAAMEKTALERLGYQVTARTGSLEALETFKACPEDFDLVITDMAMPELSGDKLASEMLRIRPGIPVFLCTGFNENLTEENVRSIGIKHLLLKPIIIRELAKKIRGALDKDKTSR